MIYKHSNGFAIRVSVAVAGGFVGYLFRRFVARDPFAIPISVGDAMSLLLVLVGQYYCIIFSSKRIGRKTD